MRNLTQPLTPPGPPNYLPCPTKSQRHSMTNAARLAAAKLYSWVPADRVAAPVKVIGAVVVAFCCVRSVDVAWLTEEVVVLVK